MTEITASAEITETSINTEATNAIDSAGLEARRIRLTIPSDQCAFIEQQVRDRKIEFNEVVYELIRDRIQQLSEPTQDPVETMSKEMNRLEAHIIEIKALIQRSDDASISDKRPNEDDAEEDEGNLARLLTAILQGYLQPPLHRLVAQIETFQKEVRDANHAMCDRDQGELDRWFVTKAELEVLREMLSRVTIAATPPERRAEFAEYIAYVTERFGQLESRLPPLPDYFLPANDDS